MDKKLNQEAWMEQALKSQPLAAMPRSVTADVMSRIQTAEAKRPALVTWSDFALSFVIASCIAALWFAVQNLPPILFAKLQIQGILLYQNFLVNARWLMPAVMFGLAAIFAAITIPSLLKMTMDHRR
jgi:hypothetical protein